jgi:hypothetical protein
LFVVVSRQTKKAILCALCVSAVNHYLRKSVVSFLWLLGFLARNPPTLKLRRIPRSLGEGGSLFEVV